MGVAPSTYLVSSFGAVDPRKGQQILVQAAALVRDHLEGEVLFIVVGDESLAGRRTGYKRRLVELAAKHRLSDMLRFIGHRQDVARLMQASDVVVQPSLLEAGALVPLEAMSCGIPVVATDVGGIPEEVINGVTGLLVPPGEPGALAEAIAGLLRDPLRRNEFGNNGRAWVSDRFSLPRQALLLYEIYAGLAHPVGPSQPGGPNYALVERSVRSHGTHDSQTAAGDQSLLEVSGQVVAPSGDDLRRQLAAARIRFGESRGASGSVEVSLTCPPSAFC
jgi:glycogen synthase